MVAAASAAAAQETGTAAADQPPSDIIGEIVESYTWTDDTLLDIARADGLGLLEVMAANPGVDRWLPGKATFIVLPNAHILPDAPRNGIVINLAELRIYFFDGEGEVHTFPIGVGRGGFTTPTGSTRIVRKRAHPDWYPTKNARDEDPELPARVAGRAGQSARRIRHVSRLADVFGPRNQQALGRRPAGLAAAVSVFTPKTSNGCSAM